MNESKKWENSKYSRKEINKEQPIFDPTITFQPKSAQMNIHGNKALNPVLDPKSNRKVSNKLYFQELTRKANQHRLLPPLPYNPSLSQHALQVVPTRSGRLCLKSDSKPTRSKKAEVVNAMNLSTLSICDRNEFLFDSQDSKIRNEFLDVSTVKTPTFNNEDEKIQYLSDLSKALKDSKPNDEGKLIYSFHSGLGSKNDSISSFHQKSEPSSASKFTGVDSSASSEMHLSLPPYNLNQHRSLIAKEKIGAIQSSRDHPKIRIRNAGFPKDVFILKNK